MLYELITYDIWGNEDEGYEVNDVFRTGDLIEVNETMTDNDIIRAMIEAGLCNTNALNKIEIEGELEYSLYARWKETCKPAFELRRQLGRQLN